MKPTKILSEEHRVIEVVLQCLRMIADEAEHQTKVNREAADAVIDFIRNFADRCHHGKEEDLLFKALNESGLPHDSGPVAAMLQEHSVGRNYVAAMADALADGEMGQPEAVDLFCKNARDYVALLQSHIQKEDRVLFPMADRLIDAQGEERLLEGFKAVEHDHMGAGTHGRYLKIAGDLARRYDVEHDILKSASCGCGH